MTEGSAARLKTALGVMKAGFGAAAPFVDLWTRIALGKAFFVSGMLKLSNWPLALELAQREYPVSWLNPHSAAVLGVAIECGGSILLIAGLLTRPAAFALLILTLVIQFSYFELDVNLFWAALLGWYVFHGAGAFSFDRALAKGSGKAPYPWRLKRSGSVAGSPRSLIPLTN